MILRRIVAKTMSEALRRVEREVGTDAMIVEAYEEDGMSTVFVRRPEPTPVAEPRQAKPRAEAQDLGTELTDVGLSPQLIRTLYRAVHGLDQTLLQKRNRALRGVLRRVVSGLLETRTERQSRVAVVGPTGVGKTTTIAKLAARDALERGLATGIITTDTYRVAAVEQLRAFADMLDLPFRVAFTPQDLRSAMRELEGLDRVWIDSSGRNPRDENALRGVRGLFAGLDIEVLLALPAAGRRRDLQLCLDTFGIFEPSALVACKWDETDCPGELISLAIERDLPLAGIGIGQRVPEDWQDADAAQIALDLIPDDTRLVEHEPTVNPTHASPLTGSL